VVSLDGGVVANSLAGIDEAPDEVDVLADAEVGVESRGDGVGAANEAGTGEPGDSSPRPHDAGRDSQSE